MKATPLFLSLILCICIFSSNSQNVKRTVSDAEKETILMLGQIKLAKITWTNNLQNKNKPEVFSPRSLTPEGNLTLVPSRDWTSGFFPGVLWLLYELTGKQRWETEARKFTAEMENEKLNASTHDMGFKMYCSFGNGYRLTHDPVYKDIIVQSARTLSTRFNPVTGCIRSWDHSRDKWGFPVIIDNMMNLELLFAATRLTGDSSFYKIAVSHANTTLKNHFRPDFSSYHVVDYDTITGNVLKRNTHQGYRHESAWARGQAWALYGYTMCFRETKDEKYLRQAEGIANFILNHPRLPEDRVPYWDFDAPNIPDEPRDASAAAITASALYELSTLSKEGPALRANADKIISSLTKNYRLPVGGKSGFILTHSTGSKPANSEGDVPLIYADYYYLESLLRKKKLN